MKLISKKKKKIKGISDIPFNAVVLGYPTCKQLKYLYVIGYQDGKIHKWNPLFL